jgi:cell division septal protein FtsQ
MATAILILAGILIFVVFKVLDSRLFSVRYLDCRNNQQSCSSQDEEPFLDLLGENLIFMDINQKQRLTTTPTKYKIISLGKIFPSTIKIELTTRTPVAQVTADKTDYYFFDSQGMVLSRSTISDQYSWLEVYSQFPLTEGVVSWQLQKTAELINELKSNQINIKTWQLTESDDLETRLGNDARIVFSLTNNIKKQVGALQLILSRSKIEGKSFQSLDLRFEKPVVIYN